MGAKPRSSRSSGGRRKRRFTRVAGVLRDVDDAEKAEYVMPASSLGAELTNGERAILVQRLGSADTQEAGLAMRALVDDRSPAKLNALLDALSTYNSLVVAELARFQDDARVQPALVRAASEAPLKALAPIARALGELRARSARQVLRRRFEELVKQNDVFEDLGVVNLFAESLEATAGSLLRLGDSSPQAADALITLLDHPCRENRESALTTLVDAWLSGSHGTKLRLESALDRILSDNDSRLFMIAVPALLSHRRAATMKRLNALLDDLSLPVRKEAALALEESGDREAQSRAREAYRRWLQESADPVQALELVVLLDGDAPEGVAKRTIERVFAERSPALRRRAFHALPLLHHTDASEVAKQALRDEPDPVLRERLEQFLKARTG